MAYSGLPNSGSNHSAINDGSNAISWSLNVDGVGGRRAAASACPFYAYIQTTRSVTDRAVVIFASRAVADEWWRAVSIFDSIQRITPQFYAHNPGPGASGFQQFFNESQLKGISDKFIKKMFFVFEYERVFPFGSPCVAVDGRTLSIIPTQSIVDHINGDWFCIRSKHNPNKYWNYDPNQQPGHIHLSTNSDDSTLFKVYAPDVHDEAIMIGEDDIILVAQYHGFVTLDVTTAIEPSGNYLKATLAESDAFKFKFRDLEDGKFIADRDGSLYYAPRGEVGRGWELAL